MLQNFHVHSLVKFYLLNKQNFTDGINYDCRMNEQQALAHNLDRLMKRFDRTQKDIERMTGGYVSQKTISNILNSQGPDGPSLNKISAIANCFKISTWHLMMPNCPEELLFNQSLEKLVQNYIINDEKGRNATLSVSEIRAQYCEEQLKQTINGG